MALAASLPFSQSANAASSSTAPYLATSGCSMAHCDQAISGNSQQNAPTGAITSLWHDTSVTGSGSGLGCSSNTHVAACSFSSTLFNWTSLKVYSPTGAQVWSSYLLGSSAYASAPMVDPSGGVIAADNSKLVRFSPTGQVLWQTNTPGGLPISPTITDNGAIVLATSGGPVSAYDPSTGALLAKLTLSGTVTSNGTVTNGYYDTVNTPAVNGNRIYISTQFHTTATNKILPFGRLYALDFTRNSDGTGTFSVAWSWDFEAPSGGSPTVVLNNGIPTVYFDGSGTTAGSTTVSPQLFALQDLGSSANLLWKYGLAVDPQAAATPDPRGGIWTFATFTPTLVRLDQNTGAVLQTINVDNLVNQPGVHLPSSAMTITGNAQNPTMIVSATPLLMQSSYVLAINLNTSQLSWDYRVDQSKGVAGVPFGQFPILLRSDGRPEVVLTTDDNGVWGLGAQ
jgi:PQQ-like domain